MCPGRYLALSRTWRKGDRIELTLDMSCHAWVGSGDCRGRVSLYRGPILLTYDRRFNEMDPGDVPALDARWLRARAVKGPRWVPPMMLLQFRAADGRPLRLCDFGSAGEGGSPYLSWLKITHARGLDQYWASGLK